MSEHPTLHNSNKEPRYLIGIDAGVHTGLAVRETRILRQWLVIRTGAFWDVYHDITQNYPPHLTTIYVENPALNKSTFDHNEKNHAKREKISRNVGANAREATLLIEELRRLGYEVIEVKPTKKKVDAKEFKAFTGFAKRTSEHARDAGMLIVGR